MIKILDQKNKEITLSIGLLILLLLVLVGFFLFSKLNKSKDLIETKDTPEVIEPINPFNEIQIEAKSAYVKNLATGEVLFKKNENESLPLASLTKLFTAVSAVELLDSDTKISLSFADWQTEGDTAIYPGEKFSIKDVVDITLVSSSNDTAAALASAGEAKLSPSSAQNGLNSKENFIRYTNSLAQKIGLENTKINNETGLDISSFKPGATGSAKDITSLLEYILENHFNLLEKTKDLSLWVQSDQGLGHTVSNTNEIVNILPNIIGSKTGYTDLAGGNLTVIIDPGLNTPLAITVLGATKSGRFSDVEKLANASLVYFSQASLEE